MNLRIHLTVNGETKQNGNTSQFIYTPEEQIEFASSVLRRRAGRSLLRRHLRRGRPGHQHLPQGRRRDGDRGRGARPHAQPLRRRDRRRDQKMPPKRRPDREDDRMTITRGRWAWRGGLPPSPRRRSGSLQCRRRAAEPIKIGCSMAMTGGVAGIGKQILIALQIWRDQINAKGGLLGRPGCARLLRRSEQSRERAGHLHQAHRHRQGRPADRTLCHQHGGRRRFPVIMQKNMMTVGVLANAANHEFHYPRYFSMNATGPDPERSYSTGLLRGREARRSPRPKTIALHRRRRRIRPQRHRGHAQERRGARLQRRL